MPHIFISYAWKDGSQLARQLHRTFNDHDGWSAWLDVKLHADSVFSHELQMQIDRADVVVVVVSPEVNRRDPPSFVQRELVYATQDGVNKPVFGARAYKCPVPLIVAGITYQDFDAGADYDAAFAKLIAYIEASPRAKPAASLRERELAYLRDIAREHGFFGKVYVDTAAEARVRPQPDPSAETATDPDIAAYLGEIMMAIHPDKRHSPDDDARTENVESFAALTDALARFERVAIIGDPGSGKTTTLRRFAYSLGDLAANDESAPLPVFVPLGGYTGGNLNAYIQQQMGNLPLPQYLPERLVVLLDGLNETAHENVADVQTWLDRNPNVRVLLTCRKLDYIERKLDLQRVDVLPLDVHSIQRFMAAYKLSAPQRETLFWGVVSDDLRAIWQMWQREDKPFNDFWQTDGGVPNNTTIAQDNVLKAVREQFQQGHYPGLLGLVRNPFLLTLTIAIFNDSGAVPRNRGQLFNAFVQLLFEQRGYPAAEKAQLEWIDAAIQQHALARLAYRMQREKGQTRVEYGWARGVVAEVAIDHNPDHLLYLAAGAGIIEKGQDIRFTHQLLQEYFAAYGLGEDIQKGVSPAVFWPDGAWWTVTGWEETAVLLAGMFPERAGWADQVARWAAPTHPVLAGRIVTECGVPVDADTRQQVRAAWPSAIVPAAPPLARADAGRNINVLGDPRPGVLAPGDVPEFVWCEVPAGRFTIGGDPAALNKWDGAEFELPYPFWIAKYPVTYAQYEPFVESRGYEEQHYWTEAGWEWKGNKTQPERYWHDSGWHIANHPVVGVTWYEAYAYTQWLNEQGIVLPGTPGDYVIRLLRECEWEKAARYPDGRLFPWGNEFKSGYANIDETNNEVGPHYLGATTAVGMYPHGNNPAHGASDLSGNVWEWCLTAWADRYESPGAENNAPAGEARRVLRGGSWSTYDFFCRAAARYGDDPTYRDFSGGFRVCVSVPILDFSP